MRGYRPESASGSGTATAIERAAASLTGRTRNRFSENCIAKGSVRMADSIVKSLPTKREEFTFKVPADSPVESERGQKQTREFAYPYCENDAQAEAVAKEKEWTFREMVNENLKANARSAQYQAALIPHRAPTVSESDIKDRMVRDFMRLGIPEAAAREQVEAVLLANAK